VETIVGPTERDFRRSGEEEPTLPLTGVEPVRAERRFEFSVKA
jgi:hypothetical protein